MHRNETNMMKSGRSAGITKNGYSMKFHRHIQEFRWIFMLTTKKIIMRFSGKPALQYIPVERETLYRR